MVHLRVEKHDFVILDFLGLKLVKGFGNNGVVHRQTLMLPVVFLRLLKLFHEHVLLVEEKLLSRAFDQLTVDFLGQGEDVVERAICLDPVHLDYKLLDSLIKFRQLAETFNVFPVENLDHGIGYEPQIDLELLGPWLEYTLMEFLQVDVVFLEDTLVVDDRAFE